MFRNYLAVALTNLFRNKLFSAINIVGLSVGLAACVLILLFVGEEVSYDRHWDGADRIYRINNSIDNNGNGDMAKFAFLPVVALPVIREYFAGEIDFSTRVLNTRREVTVGDERFDANVARVDPDFLDLFAPRLVAGDLQLTLMEPTNIAVSEGEALRLFGKRDAIGEIITMPTGARTTDYRVTAVYRLPDGNTVLDVPAFTLLDVATLPESFATSWLLTGPMTFVKLAADVAPDAVAARLEDFVNTHVAVRDVFQIASDVPTSERVQYEIQSMGDIHLNSDWDTFSPGGNRVAVYAFAAIAVLVLIIACVNFVILTTARTSTRAREIAVRKTVGATRTELFGRFVGETFLLAVLAMGIALALAELALPFFNAFVAMDLTIDYGRPAVYGVAAVLVVAVGLVGGIYPAWLLSGFKPALVLKSNQSATDDKTAAIRSVLVVFQFSVSIALLVATAVIFAQIRLGMYRDIGFNKDNLLVMDVREQLDRSQTLRDELLRLPEADQAGLSYGRPPQSTTGYYGVAYYLPDTGRSRIEILTADVGEGFFETYQIEMVAGRSYDSSRDLPLLDDYSSETGELLDRNLVINESATRLLGFASPDEALGTYVFMPGLGVDEREMRFTITGVAADTQFYSLKTAPAPEFYHFAPGYTRFMTLRFSGSSSAIVSQVQDVWDRVVGSDVLSMGFVEEYLSDELGQERLEGLVLASLAMLAIFIACLGLYGLAAFTVDRKTREIGIRKVLGATVRQIVRQLLWQLSRPVLLANVFAWPLVVGLMLDWLQRFPYQIAIWLLVPFCVTAGLLALIIAWLTVAGSAMKVAAASPVHALRYE